MPTSFAAEVDPQPSDYRDGRPCAAYLSSDLMREFDIGTEDILEVVTRHNRHTLVRVVGPLIDIPGRIRFDRYSRQSLKAFPYETVTICRQVLSAAEQVVLIPGIDLSMRHSPNLVQTLKDELARYQTPVCEGMLLYVKMPDSIAGVAYDVHSVTPANLEAAPREHIAGPRSEGAGATHRHTGESEDGHPSMTDTDRRESESAADHAAERDGLPLAGGAAVVTAETHLYLEFEHEHDHSSGTHQHEHQRERQGHAVVDTTYQDVGGLDDQVRMVREYVELPLVFPQVYRQLGVNPPRGVIFYGAPGTGKTLLARSVSNEVNAGFYYINGPEVVGTYGGETEENLRKIFSDASFDPPSIIFIDELDAIAPVRGSTSTLSDARAVTQLLSLMDGLKQAEGVMVIATTNRIDSIDPALRRAGRFDREVPFPTPSVEARASILNVHTREMPLSFDAVQALPEIARRAYGYVGADLMELCREAALTTLRRVAVDFLRNPSVARYPPSSDLLVSREDFEQALQKVRPAALRESLMSYPNVTWEDVGGLHQVKRRLTELIERPLRYPELFARLGLRMNPGVLLYGPPGCGKTLLAKAIARESGVNFIAIQGPELFSQWLGESENSVRRIFHVARRAAPCIIFFDQLDAVAPKRARDGQDGTGALQRVINQLLSELDGMEPLSQIIVIGATNAVDAVDSAILRPGRFGIHLEVGLPDERERSEIISIHLGAAILAPDEDRDASIHYLASHTELLSGADLAYLCQDAKARAIDELSPSASTEGFHGESDLPVLRLRHLKEALAELRSSMP